MSACGWSSASICRSISSTGTIWSKLLQGDLGTAVLTARPVLEDLMRVFPATLELATVAIIIGVVFGVPMGVVAATNQGRWPDHLIRITGLIGYSMPVFWLGLVGLLVFYNALDWVGGPGRLDVYYEDIVAPVTGMLLIDSLHRRRHGRVLERRVAHHPAGRHSRLSVARLYRAHDAQLHARAVARRNTS